jgi:hypothetical protein
MAEKRKASETYLAKLRNPRWQKKRLEVMQRDVFTCQICFDNESTLNVHHRYYLSGTEGPWDYPLDALVTLCESCHEMETVEMPGAIHALNIQFKRFFYSSDIDRITKGMEGMTLPHASEVWASTLQFVFENPEVQHSLLEQMFADCSKRVAEKKAKEEGAK